MTDSSRFNAKVIFTLFLVHFSGDFYSAFVRPLMPSLSEKLSLSLYEVGLVSGVFSMLAFVVQPIVGYLADRYQTRFFMLGGSLLAMIFIPFIGIANSFWVLLVFIGLGSIGSSMFHPHAAGLVPKYAGEKKGFAMACFWMGGAGAFGVGPLVATYWVDSFGLEALPWTASFGLAGFVVMFILLPKPQPEKLDATTFMGSMREIFGGVVKPLILIWLVIMMRSFVQQAVQTFLPMMAHDVGYGLISIGLILSVYVTSGTASGMLAGWLADRIGFKRVVLITLCLGTPCLLGFFHLPGNWIYLGGFLAGTMLLASMPLTVAMAQELVPKGRSMVASLMMGFAFGIGGMLTPLMGYLAEEIGLRPALTLVAFVPLLIAPLILWCPEKKAGPAGRDNASAEAL